jgi:hypothetical protein
MYHITALVPGLRAACTVSVRLIHLERFFIGNAGCTQPISTRYAVECETALLKTRVRTHAVLMSEHNASIIQSTFLMYRAHIQLAMRAPTIRTEVDVHASCFSPSSGSMQIYKSHYILSHDSHPPARLETPILSRPQSSTLKYSPNRSPGAFTTRHADVRTTVTVKGLEPNWGCLLLGNMISVTGCATSRMICHGPTRKAPPDVPVIYYIHH